MYGRWHNALSALVIRDDLGAIERPDDNIVSDPQ